MFESLLASVGINILEYGYKIGLDWLGKFAQAVIEGVGVIGWGIVVFALVLKAITLPFDIYQRVKTRKQNLIMREMQPELEKLQKQYANDKAAYNQKMMELYKKNGYSMLAACLPAIFSFVILIVAFQGFRTYSQYANLAMYEKMSRQYSEEILAYAPEMKDFGGGRVHFVLAGEGEEENLSEGKILWEDDRIIQGEQVGASSSVSYRLYREGNDEKNRYVEVLDSSADKFLLIKYWIDGGTIKNSYSVDSNKFTAYLAAHGEEPFYKNRKEGEENPTKQQVYDEIYNAASDEEKTGNVPIRRYVVKTGAMAAADWYRKTGGASFLFVKNVWYADVVYEHPIQSYDKFSKQLDRKVVLTDGSQIAITAVIGEAEYENLTSELSAEKKAYNGYFILIILSIGLMVLSQFITMRSSKESNKYQTLDGQGAKTQKIMLIMMPMIYAVFAFMYSAAFTIYMTMSSAISLAITLLSNLIIGRIFKKKEEVKAVERITRKYDWQLTEKEKKEKEKRALKEKQRQERANKFNRKK